MELLHVFKSFVYFFHKMIQSQTEHTMILKILDSSSSQILIIFKVCLYKTLEMALVSLLIKIFYQISFFVIMYSSGISLQSDNTIFLLKKNQLLKGFINDPAFLKKGICHKQYQKVQSKRSNFDFKIIPIIPRGLGFIEVEASRQQ